MDKNKSTATLLSIYDKLFNEYYVYQFDSAMVYVDKSIELADKTANQFYHDKSRIEKASLLAIGGLYGEAMSLLNEIDFSSLTPSLSFDYTITKFYISSNPQPIGFSGILLAKRQNSFYCTYFLHNRNVADTKSPYPIKRLEVIRWFNQKSMVFNQSLS
ncbi:MAG: hypothetical protein ACLR8W_03840 [Segatella copri]